MRMLMFLIVFLVISLPLSVLAVEGDDISSKELRYIKILMDRGKKNKAKPKLFELIKNSKKDEVVAEAMYLSVEWNFSIDPVDTYDRLMAYHPSSKYVTQLKSLLDEREKKRKKAAAIVAAKKAAEYKSFANDYGIKGDWCGTSVIEGKGKYKGIYFGVNTGLMWTDSGIGSPSTWNEAQKLSKTHRGGGFSDWKLPTYNQARWLWRSQISDDCGHFISAIPRERWIFTSTPQGKKMKLFKPKNISKATGEVDLLVLDKNERGGRHFPCSIMLVRRPVKLQ